MMIELASKKKFVNWLIQSVSLKKRESYWILNYLLNHEFLLDRVIFVEDVLSTPRGLLITDQTIEGTGLEMVNQSVLFSDPNQIFHDIRMNRKLPLFVGISFEGMYSSNYYLSIIEENPYQSLDPALEKEISKEIELFLKEEEANFQLQELLKKINKALEENDEQAFLNYSKKYSELKK